MSRIVVKNLPKHITSDRLRKTFEPKGQITDLQLKYTKDGIFRQFAFIGYKTEEEAAAAKDYFNGTYLDTSKLKVEICAAIGDASKPRAWSKYSKESSAHEKLVKETSNNKSDSTSETKSPQKGNKKGSKDADPLNEFEELSTDPKFLEFLEAAKRSSERPVWSNDAANILDDERSTQEKEGLRQQTTEADVVSGSSKKKKTKKVKSAEKTQISDMEFLKSKVVKLLSDEETAKDEEAPSKDDDAEKKLENLEDKEEALKGQAKFSNELTVKLRNLPYKSTKKDIRNFLYPLKPLSLRVPPKVKGIAYAKFRTEKEMKQALNKHRGFLNGHRISVVKYVEQNKNVAEQETKFQKFAENDKHSEEVGESGRIFVRNLAYTVTEDDLENLFKKYGPLAEVHLPVDRISRNVKGFAFVSFVFPEHSVKAFTELDGTSFQGRVLHLIPAKVKESINIEIPEHITFKKKKEVKEKALSGSSHNWNTLFLGANTVADIIAEKYNITKAQLLDAETKDSVAVRMALGETQLVAETRDFLEKHGVRLDVFGQPAVERSKTVILAKNLPAKTNPDEIKELFSKYGEVSQVVLPPSGITALVEFRVPAEARAAFKKLAYSKFYHVPLYLEWAPVNVFKEPEINKGVETKEEKMSDKDESSEEETEPDSTLYVKNLNFETTEESLRKVFEKYGTIRTLTIAKKKDLKNPGNFLSMGYGFVQFNKKSMAHNALKELQHFILDGHTLELKISRRETQMQPATARKKANSKKQQTTKILIRNVPFQANQNEIKQLFNVFGELRAVRLPKKLDGTHRGFAFVDFLSKSDAKRAFKSLCNSTHLYGRRLVLEWAEAEKDDVEALQEKTRRQFDDEGPKSKRLKSKDLISSINASPGDNID